MAPAPAFASRCTPARPACAETRGAGVGDESTWSATRSASCSKASPGWLTASFACAGQRGQVPPQAQREPLGAGRADTTAGSGLRTEDGFFLPFRGTGSGCGVRIRMVPASCLAKGRQSQTARFYTDCQCGRPGECITTGALMDSLRKWQARDTIFVPPRRDPRGMYIWSDADTSGYRKAPFDTAAGTSGRNGSSPRTVMTPKATPHNRQWPKPWSP